MLESRFRKAGLGAFEYKKTPWFRTVRHETREYRKHLLQYLLPLGAMIPLVLAFADTGSTRFWYFLPMAFALVQVALLRFSRRITPFAWASLAMLALCVVPAAYSPEGRPLVLYTVALFPVYALQLRGSLKGSVAYAVFMAFLAVFWGLSRLGVLPPCPNPLQTIPCVTLLVTSVMVYLLAFMAERRQEHLVGRLTDMMVFSQSTGLPNREVLSYSIDPGLNYLFAIIKIENYSDLVVLFGYDFSDTISQFASQKLTKYELRFGYKTYHLKYNEYGILVSRDGPTTTVNATQLLNEIVGALELEALPWEQDRIRLVYRVGGAVISVGDPRNPLSLADIALKKAERTQTVITVYTDDNLERETSYNYVMRFSELITNRENDTFRAVFQPIFKSDGSGIAWYEALLRVRKQDGTFASIYDYLEVARSTGFYHYLTEFILRKSAEAILEHDINVSVNISIADIVRSDFIMLVEEIHHMIRERTGRIIFEILESEELVELDKCVWFIDYVSRFGFRIAIDDFGTGYSNYINLLNLPVDIVKIDGGLIRRIRSDENARTLVEGIVHFCRKANKQTVAEFVEDDAVYDSLKHLNIDFFQGYYLSRPGPLSGPGMVGDY